jgi:hypothetical protein
MDSGLALRAPRNDSGGRLLKAREPYGKRYKPLNQL